MREPGMRRTSRGRVSGSTSASERQNARGSAQASPRDEAPVARRVYNQDATLLVLCSCVTPGVYLPDGLCFRSAPHCYSSQLYASLIVMR